MTSSTPFPLTQENVSQCWEYVDKRCRAAKRQSAIARTGAFLVTLFFYLSLIFLGGGLLSEQGGGTFHHFWESLAWFPLWQKIADFLSVPGDNPGADIGKLILLAYTASALVFAFLAVLFHLVYHPRKAPVPAGSYPENVAMLAKKAQEARDHAFRTRVAASVVAAVLAIVCLFLLFFAYVVYSEDPAAITAMLSTFPTGDLTTNCLLFVLCLYFFCGLAGSLLLFLTRPLYRYEFPYDLVVQAQREALVAGADIDLSDLPKFREEALTLERSGAYSMAMEMLHKAAVCGDVPAMEHYARHCLLKRMQDSARYWLKQCESSGAASPQAKKMLLRLKLRLQPDVEYLRPEEEPPTIGKKIAQAIFRTIRVLWKIFMLFLLAAVVLFMFLFFASGSNPELLDKLPPQAAQWITELKTLGGTSGTPAPQTEIPQLEVPAMTLSIADTKWEGNPAVMQETSGPVIFCYSKEVGGNLYIPYHLDDRDSIGSAGLYTGNKWDIRKITKHFTGNPRTNTLTVSEEFLMGLEPGEYHIILDDWCYLPLIVSDEPVPTPQIGLAAQGNEHNWIPFDLEDSQDIVLPFYNLGGDSIVSLSQMQQMVMTPKPTVLPMEPSDYTISPDGCSVTISADFLARQEVGFSMGFLATLESGSQVDTGYTCIGVCRDGFTGLMEIQGKETYSISKDADYTAQYAFGLTGSPMHLHVQLDGQVPFIEDDLTDLMSEYVDLDAGTITLPEQLLKEHLTEGTAFTIGISYGTAFGQASHSHLRVEVKK